MEQSVFDLSKKSTGGADKYCNIYDPETGARIFSLSLPDMLAIERTAFEEILNKLHAKFNLTPTEWRCVETILALANQWTASDSEKRKTLAKNINETLVLIVSRNDKKRFADNLVAFTEAELIALCAQDFIPMVSSLINRTIANVSAQESQEQSEQ